MEWADEIIVRLRELWSEGHSTAEIGRRLGVSKNAVVGKAHRLDLAARPSPIRREGERPPQRSGPPRRLAGPTLPPLSSTALSSTALSSTALSSASLGNPALGNPALGNASLGNAALGNTALASPQPAAALPPRPPVVAAPRPAAVQPRVILPPPPRPYGRVITCCWPIGEPGTRSFRFCDAESVPGKPYCTEHAQLAYVKVRDRREDAA
jgi:GcrA cell cycle regulator